MFRRFFKSHAIPNVVLAGADYQVKEGTRAGSASFTATTGAAAFNLSLGHDKHSLLPLLDGTKDSFEYFYHGGSVVARNLIVARILAPDGRLQVLLLLREAIVAVIVIVVVVVASEG
jgi:hypothetical protein